MPVPSVTKVFFPLDEILGIRDKRWSEGVAKRAVWLSGLVAYEKAATIMQEIGQVEISDSSVWRLTQKWGEKIQVLEAEEQKQAHRLPVAGEDVQLESRSMGRLGLSMDGTMIYIRGEEWKELKVGCLFDVVLLPSVDAQTKDRVDLGHALRNTYVSHLGGPEDFGRKLWTEAERRHWSRAVDTQVVADGATWIWNLVQDYFYDCHQVVDWFHAKEHLALTAQLMLGEGSSAAKRWLNEQETYLFQGHAEDIAQSIIASIEQRPQMREDLLQQAGYFEKNKRRMNYLELRSDGWVIGSGMVESGGKQYKDRFASSGMRWSRLGAERLLPIRTAIMSRRFDHRWNAIYNLPKN
jgi:hypothetical protein